MSQRVDTFDVLNATKQDMRSFDRIKVSERGRTGILRMQLELQRPPQLSIVLLVKIYVYCPLDPSNTRFPPCSIGDL